MSSPPASVAPPAVIGITEEELADLLEESYRAARKEGAQPHSQEHYRAQARWLLENLHCTRRPQWDPEAPTIPGRPSMLSPSPVGTGVPSSRPRKKAP